MSVDIPWPRPGSSIYRVKHRGHFSACLHSVQGQSYGYTEGYRRAADLVFAHIAETGSWMDSLVFPLAYLWRHALELQLKKIMADGARLRKQSGKPLHKHKLAELWVPAKEIVVSLYDQEPPGTDVVEAILAELDGLDPEATGFRFPEDKKGKPNLTQPPALLDLVNFHEVATDVHTFLDCANMEIAVRLDSLGA